MPSHLFVPTGTMETFAVPPHKPGTLMVTLRGGRGSRQLNQGSVPPSDGGSGGKFTAALDLPAGTTVHVVAGDGWDGITDQREGYGPHFGGQGGSGGTGSLRSGGAGGCSTDLRLGGTGLTDRIAVAGGGGGGGGKSGLTAATFGGRGGPGVQGWDGATGDTAQGGFGGTQSAGGAGGSGDHPGSPGALGTGGDGGDSNGGLYAGGGGGGGYYGGGGGGAIWSTAAGTGGGGSGWYDESVLTIVSSRPDPAEVLPGGGPGYVLFEWQPRRGGRHLGLVRGSRGVG